MPSGTAHAGALPPYGTAIGEGRVYFGDAAKHRIQVGLNNPFKTSKVTQVPAIILA
jgi:hypothetical protein